MKTTFDIPEPLLREVQALARERKTTAKSLVEEALRALLDQHTTAKPFKLRNATFKGKPGLTSEFADASWEQMRDEIYRGHGA
jgi:hypothetical protein